VTPAGQEAIMFTGDRLTRFGGRGARRARPGRYAVIIFDKIEGLLVVSNNLVSWISDRES
jgi:hypothetical protein